MVKHLDDAGIEDIKGFLREISLMKSVGHHENIVGIVGHSKLKTKSFNKLMLLTEYCSEGNLLDYLRYKCISMPIVLNVIFVSQTLFFDLQKIS